MPWRDRSLPSLGTTAACTRSSAAQAPTRPGTPAGALNLVEADVEARAGQLLPDKDAAIVTYCSNAACGNSQAVANKLEKLGYTNVRKYREGIQDWVEAGLPAESKAAASPA